MACTQTLAGLTFDCAANQGGIKEVYIANYDDVASVTVTTDKISAISMSASAKFKTYSFKSKEINSMTSTLNVDDKADVSYVSTELALQFNRMETAKRVEIVALAKAGLAVIVLDNNGKYWYLGYDEPVFASAGDGATGTGRTDANKYGITLKDNSIEFPYEVDGTAVASVI